MLDKLTAKWIVKLSKTDTEGIGQWCKVQSEAGNKQSVQAILGPVLSTMFINVLNIGVE